MGKMPITILAGTLFVVAALVLYTIGAIGAFRKKGASKRDLMLLWLGFGFDVLGTAVMAVQTTAAVSAKLATNASAYIFTLGLGGTTVVLENGVSTYLALLGMVGMLVVIILAARAAASKDEKAALTMSRVIFAPWIVWVVSFVMMSAEKMPKR
ncbi:MAG TPA: hypothetical protein VIK83_04200 [Coriobacteriia bacterium]